MGEGVALRRPIGAPQTRAAAEAGFAVDMFGRDFGDESAGNAAHPLAVDTAVGGLIDARALPGAGDRDIGKAAFLLEAGGAALVHCALRREDALLPAAEADMIEFEAFGCMDRIDGDGVGL